MQNFSEFVKENLKDLSRLYGQKVKIASLEKHLPFTMKAALIAVPKGDFSNSPNITFSLGARWVHKHGIQIRWLEWHKDGQTFALYKNLGAGGRVPVEVSLL